MMDESELRRRFAQLRESDQKTAPNFAHGAGRARARRRATPRVRTLVIGAAAAVAMLAVWLSRAQSVSSEPTPTIANWRAPTDILLRTPGRDLLGAMPALGASVLDTIIPTHSNRGA